MLPLPLLLLGGVVAAAVVASSSGKSSARGGSMKPGCNVKIATLADLTDQEKSIIAQLGNKNIELVGILEMLGYDDDTDGIKAFQKAYNSWIAYHNVTKGKNAMGIPVSGNPDELTVLALGTLLIIRDMMAMQNVDFETTIEWEKGSTYCS